MLVNRVRKPHYCKICKKTAGIKVCKCQKVFYCSKNCQKIDWIVHKDDCFAKLKEHHKSSNIDISSSTNHNGKKLSEEINYTNAATSVHTLLCEQNTSATGQKHYDPTPLQYQQTNDIYTHNQLLPIETTTFDAAVSDFDENLFNIISEVDSGTEEELLKSLNIHEDELLQAYSLNNGNNVVKPSIVTSSQVIKDYVPFEENLNCVDDQLNEKLLDQIHRKLSYEFRPETQLLLKETKENLEKELSLFCENQQLAVGNMHLSTENPKYINHTFVQDNIKMRSPDEELALEEMCQNLISDLNAYGVCVLDSFIGEEKGLKILDEVKQMYTAGKFKDGQLVSAIKKIDQKHIRSDKIMWVEGKEQDNLPHIKFLMNQVDAVIAKANRMNNNGKLGQYRIRERTKAMVACYEGKGSHYVKHVDNPNKDGRCITCIYYLNVNWDSNESGGLLRIYPSSWTDRVADVEPIFDRIVFFWSDRRNPHEVQPSHRTRYAVTLWYFDADERELAVRKYQKDYEILRKKA